MKSLAEGLRLLPGVQIIWLEDETNSEVGLGTLQNHLSKQALSAIMVDNTFHCLSLFLSCIELNPAVPIIMVDKAEHTFTVLCGHQYPGNTLEDLILVLEKSQAILTEAKSETKQTCSSIVFSDMP